MAENRDFKGVWISKGVWLDEKLNALDKVILTEIDSLDNSDKGCYASNKYLAEFCQCSENKVSKTISKLTELGYIEIIGFDGRHRAIKSKINNTDTQKVKGSLTKSKRQDSKKCEADTQKVKANNIDNNKDNNIDSLGTPAVMPAKKTRKTKKEKALDKVIGKLQEYDFSEKVETKIIEFYEDRIEKKDYPAENQLTMTFNNLAAVSERKQLAALKKSISNGYKGIFIDNKNGKYDGIHIQDKTYAQKEKEKQDWDAEVKKGKVYTY